MVVDHSIDLTAAVRHSRANLSDRQNRIDRIFIIHYSHFQYSAAECGGTPNVAKFARKPMMLRLGKVAILPIILAAKIVDGNGHEIGSRLHIDGAPRIVQVRQIEAQARYRQNLCDKTFAVPLQCFDIAFFPCFLIFQSAH